MIPKSDPILRRSFLLLLLLAIGVLAERPPLEKDPKIDLAIEREGKLLPNEEANLRAAIKGGTLKIGIRPTPERMIRELVVPENIKKRYQEKPISTLKVLLAFIENKPADLAFKASCYADALHVNPTAAATTVALTSLDYDAPIKKGHPSLRAIHSKTWTRIIHDLEKEAEDN